MSNNEVQSMVDEIKQGSSKPGGANSERKCAFIVKLVQLPESMQGALEAVMQDADVNNADILGFINSRYEETGVRVSIHHVREHRAKRGCYRCDLGG